MRKLLFVGIMIFCVSFVYAQDDGYKPVIKPDSIKNDLKFLDDKYGDLGLDTIIQIFTTPQEVEKQSEKTAKTPSAPTNNNSQEVETQPQEIVKTPPPNENVEVPTASRKITSSGSTSSSSARKSSTRKRSKRKKISLKRKRPKIKRKRKLGNRAACPRF